MPTELYTDRAHLARAINPRVLESVGLPVMDQAISDASRLVDAYLTQRFVAPLLTWGGDVKFRVAQIAIKLIFDWKGGNPEGDSIIERNYDAAIAWFRDVAAGKVNVDITDSSAGAVEEPSTPRAAARSQSRRGFIGVGLSGTPGAGRRPRIPGWPDGSG